jgi:hypothetical protein
LAQNPLFYDITEEGAVNGRTALLNSGYLVIYTGSQPALDGSLTGTLLVTLTFGATAFAAASASAGTVTANANGITSGTAVATGTAAYFALLKSDGVTVVMTGTVGTSNADLIGPSTAISNGANVQVSSFQILQPQSGG